MVRPNEGRKRRSKQLESSRGKMKTPFHHGGWSAESDYPYPSTYGHHAPATEVNTNHNSTAERGERSDNSPKKAGRSSRSYFRRLLRKRVLGMQGEDDVGRSQTSGKRPERLDRTPIGEWVQKTWEASQGTPIDSWDGRKPSHPPLPSVEEHNECLHSATQATRTTSTYNVEESTSYPGTGLEYAGLDTIGSRLGALSLSGLYCQYSDLPLGSFDSLSMIVQGPSQNMIEYDPFRTITLGDLHVRSSSERGYDLGLSGDTPEFLTEHQIRLIYELEGIRQKIQDFESAPPCQESLQFDEGWYTPRHSHNLDLLSTHPELPPPIQSEEEFFKQAEHNLALYNNSWSLLLAQSSRPHAPTPSIPWPTKPPNFTRSALFQPNPHAPRDLPSSELPSWNARSFFLHAFHLHPSTSQSSSGQSSFTYSDNDKEKRKKRERLQGLRRQLKMEKVRWHEDKLRAIFGDEVVSDEVVKIVWGVVIGLKEAVEKAMEQVGDRGNDS
ncbi:hypothetical protein G7Y89_g8499 [Cudoniella acicularis]|uniref:Uncharacterized protein n=1 Tax=Cudoniella acicularis TaxID=354080 RepID=A0A8H4RGF9_9HELO|nr:hypothetical protein G7Y89_g8499 [Cudoniella acicularis]